MDEMTLLYVPCSSHDEAKVIARTLVQEHLAACVSIFPGVTSFYEWGQDIKEEEEYVLLVKTVTDKVHEAKQRVVELHSFECPCVLILPALVADDRYAQWVRSKVSCC